MADKLNNILSRTGTKQEPEDEDLGKCASRPVTKYVSAFHVMNGALPVRTFDYQHLGFKQFEPTKFIMEFHEPEHWRLTVEGRNLWDVYNYLCHHRLEWIKAIDRDFDEGKKAVITKILIEKIEEKTEG